MRADAPYRAATGWKRLLLALCALSLIATSLIAANAFGLGSRAWLGWWDAQSTIVGQPPYVIEIAQPRADGASAAGGLRDGDHIDLRRQSLDARIGILFQPLATRPSQLTVQRNSQTIRASVLPSTIWEGATAWKLTPMLVVVVTNLWFIFCALLIALRRSGSRDARILALVLLCLTGAVLMPNYIALPSGGLRLTIFLLASASWLAASLLILRLSSQFGRRSAIRSVFEVLAYAGVLLVFLADVATITGLSTLLIDPLPFAERTSALRNGLDTIAAVAVLAAVGFAVTSTAPTERPRAAWLLLPLPIAFVGRDIALTVATFVHSWFANIALITVLLLFMLLGALAVTYALLKRRVLDIEFVLSRTLVVATISLIVVVAFVLLEWLLGTVLAGASHATGLVANGLLALALGLSMNFIHKRVDAFIDTLFFRKRRDDEQALRDFSKEAGYVTDSESLLDQAIAKIERHTDARGAALLLDGDRAYCATRAFGSVSVKADENDAAILALKAWHKPLDPHRYATALQGALALPMLVRGQLLGVVLVGERAGGEAYAPDEVDALALFSQGVGSALDSLSHRNGDGLRDLRESIARIENDIAKLTSELRERLS